MSEQLIPTPSSFGENGNFLLERELGEGGMGGVYMGRDKMLDRPVAVKVMQKEYGADAEFLEKFKKEAQAAARLIHPNIAQIYSYGLCDGMPYIAMELAAGGSLYSVMTANLGHADITRVLKICQQTALALQCANDQGCVHGDVKPENILLDANGNAKLVDFGLAAMQKDSSEIWGTPYYISPERVRKEPVDFRADMYSLGGTLYHALTGVAPFEGDDSIAVVKKRFEGAPKKPSEIRPEISPAVDELVMKMLALNRDDRYPSFEALLQAFQQVLTVGLTKQPTGSATVTSSVHRTATARTRRRVMVRRRSLTPVVTPSEEADNEDKKPEEDEEESGGNLGLKVALCVIGGLFVIGAIIGGLIWFKVSSEAAEEAAVAEQIKGGFEKAREAIADTVKKAGAFADEFDAFAKKAITECQKPTDDLKKILPEDQAALLKPEISEELRAAIAATNAPAAVVTPPSTNAPAAKAEEKPAAAEPAEGAANSAAVVTMNELWDRAYSCQASAIRIRQKYRELVAKAAEADAIKTATHENMDKLADLSRTIVDLFDQMKGSKDVENVKKGIAYIKSKGEKTVEQTVKRLRIEKIEAERKIKNEAAAAAEKERLEREAAERKQRIETETASLDELFSTITAQGSFRQLDWKGALRQIETAKGDLKTVEAQLKADLLIRKVSDMKKTQDVFVRNLRGYQFHNAKGLRGAKVDSVSDKEIVLVGGKRKLRITWQKFYKDYAGGLNEIINHFIVNGRKNARPALNLRDWSDAMTGAALTLQLVCNEVNGAVERGNELAKETVKQFPEYLETAKAIFPEITFDATAE